MLYWNIGNNSSCCLWVKWLIHCKISSDVYLFIYLFPEFRMQPCNSKSREHNTVYEYAMHTWILQDECVTTYIAPINKKLIKR